jgi:hypothetical protein
MSWSKRMKPLKMAGSYWLGLLFLKQAASD